jgi:hypothetical protein
MKPREGHSTARRRGCFVALVSVGLLLAFSGCATAPVKPGDRALLDFLHDGTTSRTEVVERLGEPSAQLKADGVLCYRIAGDSQNGYAVVLPRRVSSIADDRVVSLSLVLTFDESGVLQRHALVPVR